jgi:ABC-2 type transport system permease protein
MAELSPTLHTLTGARLTWAQFRSIAWLRWRIYVNAYRRKGGKAELIARLLLYPIAFCFVLGPALLAGFFAWFLSMHGSLAYLSFLFWAAFVLSQLVNINLGQPGTTFDPVELIRFPMALRNYVAVRLCFGLLSPANVIVSLVSAAIFLGITIDRPQLWPWTLLITTAFSIANVLFSRMVFAWVDRWLSTRRAREIFTAVIFAGSLGVQYLNVTYNPGFNHGRHHNGLTPQKIHSAQAAFQHVHHWLRWLPPELSGSAILAATEHKPALVLGQSGLVAAYAVLFLLFYAFRMRTEYQGENLSDQANAVRPSLAAPALHNRVLAPALAPQAANLAAGARWFPPTLGTLLGKELLVLRRNTGLLYGIVAPMVMVFLFAGRISLHGNSHWLLLIAVAYALLGLAPQSYNSFGLEGPGAQFYFMAPVPLRDVFLAKNVMHFLLALVELFAIVAIVINVAGLPTVGDILFVSCWAAGTLCLSTTLGNLRSISAPKRVNPGRGINRTQSQVSAWISMGILAGSTAIAFGLQALATWLRHPWLGLTLIAAYAIGGLITYQQGLRDIEAYAMGRRDTLFEELGKKT